MADTMKISPLGRRLNDDGTPMTESEAREWAYGEARIPRSMWGYLELIDVRVHWKTPPGVPAKHVVLALPSRRDHQAISMVIGVDPEPTHEQWMHAVEALVAHRALYDANEVGHGLKSAREILELANVGSGVPGSNS